MGLREIKTFELTCDRATSPSCQGKTTKNEHRVLTAYDIKSAHKIMRANGWKVNDGDRGGKRTSYVCPACRLNTTSRKR